MPQDHTRLRIPAGVRAHKNAHIPTQAGVDGMGDDGMALDGTGDDGMAFPASVMRIWRTRIRNAV